MPMLTGLVAALLAAVAPSTTARQPPPQAVLVAPTPQIRVLRIPVAEADRRTRTCNARGSQRQSNRVERRLQPVACEQPPRSKVILTLEGGLLGNGR